MAYLYIKNKNKNLKLKTLNKTEKKLPLLARMY